MEFDEQPKSKVGSCGKNNSSNVLQKQGTLTPARAFSPFPSHLRTYPRVGCAEVTFDGTFPFRGWQTCPGPTLPIYQRRKGSFIRFGG